MDSETLKTIALLITGAIIPVVGIVMIVVTYEKCQC